MVNIIDKMKKLTFLDSSYLVLQKDYIKEFPNRLVLLISMRKMEMKVQIEEILGEISYDGHINYNAFRKFLKNSNDLSMYEKFTE